MIRGLLVFLLWAATLALAVVSVLPLIPTDIWWVRITDFPRLQFALLELVVIAFALALIRCAPRAAIAALAVNVAALGYHASILWPYAPAGSDLTRADCTPSHRLSVMVANVKFHNHPDGQLIEQVRRRQPDIFLALEVDREWTRALTPLQKTMPHTVGRDTGSYFGIRLYSRLPLVSPDVRHLAAQDTPQIVTGVKLHTGETVDFLGIHPRPPHPSQSALGRDAVLIKAALLLRGRDRPGLIAGDLNATPWESTVQRMRSLARLIDPRAGYGYLPTYDAQSWWMAWPLDHVFYTSGFAATTLERGDAFGSDHYPYIAHLCRVKPAQSQHPEQPEAEVLRWAHGVIERARERQDTAQ